MRRHLVETMTLGLGSHGRIKGLRHHILNTSTFCDCSNSSAHRWSLLENKSAPSSFSFPIVEVEAGMVSQDDFQHGSNFHVYETRIMTTQPNSYSPFVILTLFCIFSFRSAELIPWGPSNTKCEDESCKDVDEINLEIFPSIPQVRHLIHEHMKCTPFSSRKWRSLARTIILLVFVFKGLV